MAKGELGPTHLVTDMMRDRLTVLVGQGKSSVLDGFPRTLQQAEMLTDLGLPDRVVFLSVTADEVVRRISGRLSCACGAVYHRTDAPPKVTGVCDRCERVLFTRPDDEEAAVRVRMEEYATQTLPLLDYYRNARKLIEINGSASPGRVTDLILHALRTPHPG
jgi:adenylate kinase